MSASETLFVLGDEHVGPVASAWSLDAAPTATRATPQPCETLGDALACALTHLRAAARTANWPWVRRADGRVLSPAYLRAYLRGPARTPNG